MRPECQSLLFRSARQDGILSRRRIQSANKAAARALFAYPALVFRIIMAIILFDAQKITIKNNYFLDIFAMFSYITRDSRYFANFT